CARRGPYWYFDVW
nr:immunoglobulin heavy chain junction region [Mus musculus]